MLAPRKPQHKDIYRRTIAGVGNKAERIKGVSVRMRAKNQNNNGGVHGSDRRYENINILEEITCFELLLLHQINVLLV